MAGQNYYLITALPPLDGLGTPAPMTSGELLEHVHQSPSGRVLVEAIFLSDDLLQREALLAGEIEHPEPAVLTAAQLCDEEPLPDYLIGTGGTAGGKATIDTVLSAYYEYASDTAGRVGCPFVSAWVSFEVAMRNALVLARAKALQIEPGDYLVAVALGDTGEDFTGVISEWSAAPDPLAGMRILDGARWRWISEHDEWFSFADDELAAYAAKLMLIHRWERLSRAAQGQIARASAEVTEQERIIR